LISVASISLFNFVIFLIISWIQHLPSFILLSLVLLYFITLSSTSSCHHPGGPMVALERAILFPLLLHVQDTSPPRLARACLFADWLASSRSSLEETKNKNSESGLTLFLHPYFQVFLTF
jgi:hypothetical protein